MKPHEIIVQHLRDNGIKQRFVAHKTGIPESTLSQLLSGRMNMKLDEFLVISEALNIDTSPLELEFVV
jgi:transcriptional regulator with XRE-family HTH domain